MKTKSFLTSIKRGDAFITAMDVTAGANTSFLDYSSYIWCCGIGTNSLTLSSADEKSPVANVANKQFVTLISGSAQCVAALDTSSYAWIFGSNLYGELGINIQGDAYGIPQSVVGDKRWNSLSSGFDFFCGLDFSSYAWAWGKNAYGTLGNNTTTNRSSPVSVVGNMQFIKLAADASTVCALDSSSYAWAWGTSTAPWRSSPVSVIGNNQFIDIKVGGNGFTGFIMAIDSSSYIWAWGDNGYGQYGNNTRYSSTSPVSVLSNEWSNIFVCGNTIFAEKNSNVYAWGDNTYYQYGNNKVSYSTPTLTKLPRLKKICVTYRSGFPNEKAMVALDTSSRIWTWGTYNNGSLGINNFLAYSEPIKPLLFADKYDYWTPPSFSKIGMCGNGDSITYTMLYLDTSSNLWTWGSLQNNWFSTDVQRSVFSPVSVPVYPGTKFRDFRMGYTIGGQNGPIAALDTSSYAWMWAADPTYGVLGVPQTIAGGATSYPVSVVGNKQWLKVIPTYHQAYGLDMSSYLWAWGLNTTYGGLGDNTVIDKSSPVSVVGGRQAIQMAIAHCYPNTTSHNASCCGFLDSSSYAWTFGSNFRGALGNNLAANSSSPVSVVGAKQFIKLGATFNSFFALDASSYLWAWGENASGKLGIGNILNQSSPVSVIGNKQFIFVPDSGYCPATMIALDGSSYAWTWGSNIYGLLGNPSIGASCSSPVSVIGNYQFMDIVLAQNNIIGIRSYPNSECLMWGLHYRYANNFNIHASVNITFSAPVVTRFNTYIRSPVSTRKRKNILGKS